MSEFEDMVQDWVSIATQHGASFENVEFRDNDDDVFVAAVDPNQDCHIFIPESLLVPADAIEITSESTQISPDYPLPDQLRLLFDQLLQFVLSDQRAVRLRSLHEEFGNLPEDLFNRLKATRCLPSFIPDIKNQQPNLKRQLLRTRTIRLSGKGRVLIPLLDFVNHHPSGTGFASADGGLEIKGKASDSGEFFAAYSPADPIHILNIYAFSGESNFAYSIPCQVKFSNGLTLSIGRRYSDTDKSREGLPLPSCQVQGSQVTLSHVMLGCVRRPRRPFWSFSKAWLEAGLDDPIMAYSSILRHNWKNLVDLQRLATGVDGHAAAMLRETLFTQMDILSENLIELSAVM